MCGCEEGCSPSQPCTYGAVSVVSAAAHCWHILASQNAFGRKNSVTFFRILDSTRIAYVQIRDMYISEISFRDIMNLIRDIMNSICDITN